MLLLQDVDPDEERVNDFSPVAEIAHPVRTLLAERL